MALSVVTFRNRSPSPGGRPPDKIDHSPWPLVVTRVGDRPAGVRAGSGSTGHHGAGQAQGCRRIVGV